VKRSVAIRIWDGLWLALALLPLAIFWSGRNDAFLPEEGSPDDSLAGHVWASALYLVTVWLIIAWMRGRGTRGRVLGRLTFIALIGVSFVFQQIGEATLREAGIAGLGFDVAIAIIVYLAASMAAWVLLWLIADAVRRRRNR
jgi:hypothetical protein